MEEVHLLSISDIYPSPLNPRKHLDAGATAELAESIKQVGVQQPIVVRHLEHEGLDHFEVVFGHRRLAAATLAGETKIPAIKRSLTDDQVLEIQIIENSQREDVHPLDEADGFKALIARGYTIARVADKIGRTPAFVAARLQLVQLGKEGRATYDAGGMSLGAALAIARVPTKLQAEVIDELMPHWKRTEGYTINAAHAQRTIREHFMLVLVDAPFDIGDPDLVKKAGSCITCPKRTSNQSELFVDLQGDDLCTDPTCFKTKCDAVWKRIKKDPTIAGGAEIIEGPSAVNAAKGYSNEFVSLDSKFYDHKVGKDINVSATMKRAKDEAPPVLLTQDPDSGRVVKVVRRADIEKLVRSNAKANGDDLPSAQSVRDGTAAFDAKRKLDKLVANRVVERAIASLDTNGLDVPVLRIVTCAFADRIWNDHQKEIIKRRSLDPVKKRNWAEGPEHLDSRETLVRAVEAAGAVDLMGYALELALRTYGPESYSDENKVRRNEILALVGIDEKEIRKEVTTEIKTAKAEKLAKAKARAKKKAAKAKAQ